MARNRNPFKLAQQEGYMRNHGCVIEPEGLTSSWKMSGISIDTASSCSPPGLCGIMPAPHGAPGSCFLSLFIDDVLSSAHTSRSFQLLCHRLGSWEQTLRWDLLWGSAIGISSGSTSVEGKGSTQEWTEGEVKLGCHPQNVLSWLHGRLWTWNSKRTRS